MINFLHLLFHYHIKMSIQIRQSFLKEEATKINPDNFKVVKSVTGPNGKEFKIYDLEYYANELDKFE